MSNNILITGIGGPTPRSIAKTIRKLNQRFRIIGIDSNPKALGFFIPGLVDNYFVSPRVDNQDYWPFILDLIKNESIDLAFVQPEVEVIGWGQYQMFHNSLPCPVLIPPFNLASCLIDKSIMADLLMGTNFIPKTIKVTQSDPKFSDIECLIGYPCWIRATKGSGGLGSLKLYDQADYKSWLFINKNINEFTVSEYLPGRHLANQMLYYSGEYLKGASVECVEYIMANVAPSKVTGNTSFGRFINEDRIQVFCNDCVNYLCGKVGVKPHGVLSFDLKEDNERNLKVTEVNIRHMAYTGVMAEAGCNLVEDTISLLQTGTISENQRQPLFNYMKPYIFLRDVDTEPILLENEIIFSKGSKLHQ